MSGKKPTAIIDMICHGADLRQPGRKADTFTIVGDVMDSTEPLEIPTGLVRITIEPAEFAATNPTDKTGQEND
jgi:hypothetical protein